ncbi:MAG: response regulator transcription factor [Solirubrobacterales bacterium]
MNSSPSPSSVLIVDDDSDIRTLVCTLLQRAGIGTLQAGDGEEGLKKFFKHRPDLVLLDVSMPRMDGFQTLSRIRSMSEVPVLMLTARGQELEKVQGLRSGADDYVTKPFGRQELVARVEALLRRGSGVEGEASEVLKDPLVTVDFARAQVTVEGKEVKLTPLEFRLLAAFVRNPNQVLSSDQLLELVWGSAGASRDQVKLYVGYLRRKLREDAQAEPIETVRGFGYRYQPDAPVAQAS